VTLTCVITARPSYGRIKSALTALRTRGVDVSVVCVASALLEKYGDVAQQIMRDGFPVTWQGYTQVEGATGAVMARTIALTGIDLVGVFHFTQPDLVVTIADRHETLATAYAAACMNLPLVHIQGGEVSGSIDGKIRSAVTALADLHLVSTPQAQERVSRFAVGDIVVTGCPSIDLARGVNAWPLTKLPGTGVDVDPLQPFLLVLQHPETEVPDEAHTQIQQTQLAVEAVGLPVIWFWPNADAGTDHAAKAIRTWSPKGPVHFVRQVPPEDFVRLMRQCSVLVGNSSAGIREASALGVKVVNIGQRQRGRERAGNVIDVEHHPWQIARAVHRWLDRESPEPSDLYGDGRAGVRIAEAIMAWQQQRRVA
jgi:UDP-hydrolysing UDP-N-acetyl-D-glucosamine 2-epimerase